MEIDFIDFFCTFLCFLLIFVLCLFLGSSLGRLFRQFRESQGEKAYKKVLSYYHDNSIEFKNDEKKLLLIFESMNSFEIYCLLNHFGVKKREIYNHLLVQLFGNYKLPGEQEGNKEV